MKKIFVIILILVLIGAGYYVWKNNAVGVRDSVAQFTPLPDTDFILREKQSVGLNHYFITQDTAKFETYIFKVSTEQYARGAKELRYNKANMQGWSRVSKVE